MSWAPTSRELRVIAMREQERASFREIGAAIGVGCRRAREIYMRGRIRLSNQDRADEILLYGLPQRAFAALETLNLATREQVAQAIAAGRLRPGARGCRNYGPKTHVEVLEWLRLNDPTTMSNEAFTPGPLRCAVCGAEIRPGGGWWRWVLRDTAGREADVGPVCCSEACGARSAGALVGPDADDEEE